MIEWIIRRSVANRFLVLMGALFLSIWGTWTIINTPVDALPDLSDVQVIIKTSYPGQAPTTWWWLADKSPDFQRFVVPDRDSWF